MTEEIGLIVRAKLKGDPAAMDKLKQDVGKSVSEGQKKGLADFKVPGNQGKLQQGPQGSSKADMSKGIPTPSVPGSSTDSADKQAAEQNKDNSIMSGVKSIGMSLLSLTPGLNQIFGKGSGGGGGGGGGEGEESEGESGGGEGGGAEGAEGGGMAEAGVAGMAAGMMIQAIQAVTSILEKIWDLLVQASPMLNSSIMMITKAIMLFLMPVGNVIAALLRPFAQMFMQQAIANLKAGTSSDPTTVITDTFTNLFKALAPILLLALLVILPDLIVGVVQAVLNVIGESLGKGMGSLGAWIWDNITKSIGDMKSSLSGFGVWLWNTIVSAIGTMADSIGGFGGWLYNAICFAIGNLSSFLDGFGTWLYNGICTAIGDLGTYLGDFGLWLYDGICTAIGDMGTALGGFGSWLLTTIENAIGTLGTDMAGIGTLIYDFFNNCIASLIDSIRNWDSGLPILGKPFTGLPQIAYLAEGGTMTSEGIAYLHPGEVVKDGGQIQSMIQSAVKSAKGGSGGDTHIQMHIHGDVNDANGFSRKVAAEFKRQMATMNTR